MNLSRLKNNTAEDFNRPKIGPFHYHLHNSQILESSSPHHFFFNSNLKSLLCSFSFSFKKSVQVSGPVCFLGFCEKTSFKRKRGVFQKDLQHMMYGFGDDANPLPETVTLVEDIVVEYVTDLAHKAQDIGTKRGKLSVEDFLYLIRKDMPKLNRCTELLSMQEELKQARKAFEKQKVQEESGMNSELPVTQKKPILQFRQKKPVGVDSSQGKPRLSKAILAGIFASS
ncbi:hypothetical protein V6N13_032438 [Hibiscus sabdariffa]